MKKILFLFLTIALGFHVAQAAEQDNAFQFLTGSCLQIDDYSFKLLTGQEIQEIIPFMVQQRMAVFGEYPYFYAGTIQEDLAQVQWSAGLLDAAVAVAYYKREPIGFVSGANFVEYAAIFENSCALFEKHGYNPNDFYYVPEAIVVAEHRGKWLFRDLHWIINMHAQMLGYKAMCLIAGSHEHYSRKPVDYRGPEGAFMKAGYYKTQMTSVWTWATIQGDGSVIKQEHSLDYWIKLLWNYCDEPMTYGFF
ncbi:MAG TPA: hypothetical protein VGT41_02645 [Candidatus Babeliales bacterium]|nr:hypothetical protein [Candidatus Babeliales bacterium]